MVKRIIYIVLAIAMVGFMVFKLKSNKETSEERVYQYDIHKPVSVKSIVASLEPQDTKHTYTGTFEPEKESKISTDFQGKVNAVYVDVGSEVNKGQTLIQLDNSLLKLQLQSLEFQIQGLETDVKRYSVLAKADAIQGVQLEKAELGLKTAKVQKATLLEQISKTTVCAPFNGIITAKFTEEGAFAAPGMPLLQITKISSLKLTINVPEDKLAQFKKGQVCDVQADVYPEVNLSGKVVMIASKANPGNSYAVQLEVKNTDDAIIKAGMFGKVFIRPHNILPKIAIPASAVVGSSLQPQVYTARNGKARLQDITISERLEDKVIIANGIAEGDIIITNGFINLFDGANVVVK